MQGVFNLTRFPSGGVLRKILFAFRQSLDHLRLPCVEIHIRRLLWDQADEKHHAGDGEYQYATVDIERNTRIVRAVGVDSVRHGLASCFESTEQTTCA